MVNLLIATRNRAKAERLRTICLGAGVVCIDPGSAADAPTVDETGGSHLAIAVQKAVAWSRLHGGVAIASDGGLVIPALGDDWLSLVTRRATGGDVSDEEHAARLLRRMGGLHGDKRSANWTEAIAVARKGSILGAWEASGLHGSISGRYNPSSLATPGFWVSGLWLSAISRRALWELSAQERIQENDPWSTLAGPVAELLRRLQD
ncbi:MAG: Inosine/xanthosine triphosphate pyrophosphatase, all-alpha NTP-PPase family [Chloroflexi bacterium]|jgi:inosine/xanthosine triphosphate pyrophosphatase family protein|nr:MAG: Inosine/xanthosine triphosphate pyrophosphatase, all-alpha NTP-PPase family [Chloroflexota bacterium]